jgi:hypothetical protein
MENTDLVRSSEIRIAKMGKLKFFIKLIPFGEPLQYNRAINKSVTVHPYNIESTK